MKEKKELLKQGEIGPDVVLRDIAEDHIENGSIKVSVGDDGKIFRRVSESIDWMECRSGLGKEDHLFGVATDNNFNFCAFGRNGVILKSPDRGVSWWLKRKKAGDGNVMKGAYGNKTWLAILDKGKQAGCLLKSTDDGETWFEYHCGIPNACSIEFLNGRFYVGTKDSDIFYGDGSGKWTKVKWEPIGVPFKGARCLGYNPTTKTYFAAGHQLAISLDGVTFWAKSDLRNNPDYGERNIYCIVPAGVDTFLLGDDHLMFNYKNAIFNQVGSLGKGAIFSALLNDDRIVTVGANGEKYVLREDLGQDVDDSDGGDGGNIHPEPGQKTNAQWLQEGIDKLKAAADAFSQVKL